MMSNTLTLMHIFPYLYPQAASPSLPRMWAYVSSTNGTGQTSSVVSSPALDLLSILRLQVERNSRRGFSEALEYAEVWPKT